MSMSDPTANEEGATDADDDLPAEGNQVITFCRCCTLSTSPFSRIASANVVPKKRKECCTKNLSDKELRSDNGTMLGIDTA